MEDGLSHKLGKSPFYFLVDTVKPSKTTIPKTMRTSAYPCSEDFFPVAIPSLLFFIAYEIKYPQNGLCHRYRDYTASTSNPVTATRIDTFASSPPPYLSCCMRMLPEFVGSVELNKAPSSADSRSARLKIPDQPKMPVNRTGSIARLTK